MWSLIGHTQWTDIWKGLLKCQLHLWRQRWRCLDVCFPEKDKHGTGYAVYECLRLQSEIVPIRLFAVPLISIFCIYVVPCLTYDPRFFNRKQETFTVNPHIPKVLEISRSTSCKTFLVLDPQRCVLPWLGHGEVLKFGPCTNINMSQLQPAKV